MDLKGAEIRNILEMCMSIGSKNSIPLNVKIPYYQRPYRWDSTHIFNLMNDFFKNKEEAESNEYFVGSVVLVEDSKAHNQYDIVDGQQRVTTVFLLNYLRFIILRSYIEECISLKRANLDGYLKTLVSIYADLLGSVHAKKLESMRQSIIKKMDPMYELSDSEREKVFDEIADEYRKTVYLPERDLSDLNKYLDEYENLQVAFFKDDILALKYDRSTFNEALKKALAKACVIVSKDSKPEFHKIGVTEKTDPNVKQFINAIECEFNSLEKLLTLSGKPMENTISRLNFITDMIDNIKFCVIMTGNERDAYTLFEVLNDRALEIDDLELIKNLFLKAYCISSGENEALIDQNVGTLDQIWGDEIFTRDMTVTHTKLVSYLGTIYLTANEKAFINKVERYREIIDNGYLYNYNKTSNPYSFTKAKNDIRVYHMAKLIIQEYGLPVNFASAACVRAENDASVSITYRTFHLLNALKQNGVLAALSNMVIRSFINKMSSAGEKDVDIDDFKKYLAEIKSDSQHNANSGEFRAIHEFAFKLWKAALLCKDWELPRELAKKGIQNISKERFDPDAVMIDHATRSKMISQFKDWLQDWQYGSSNDLKVKVLFINLFKTKNDILNKELTFDKAVYTFVTEKLQLDHMEANNPNPSNISKHFTPTDPHEQREKYTNTLGNFMILDDENNNNKNNKPLSEALQYYEKMCKDHWLNKETKELLDNYHNDVQIGADKFPVPTEQFFSERRARLMFYFEKIVLRDLYDTKVRY